MRCVDNPHLWDCCKREATSGNICKLFLIIHQWQSIAVAIGE